ncbi:MAG: hypothetical protein ACTSP2_06020, partial [Alphaproteobacteria bacterium]
MNGRFDKPISDRKAKARHNRRQAGDVWDSACDDGMRQVMIGLIAAANFLQSGGHGHQLYRRRSAHAMVAWLMAGDCRRHDDVLPGKGNSNHHGSTFFGRNLGAHARTVAAGAAK